MNVSHPPFAGLPDGVRPGRAAGPREGSPVADLEGPYLLYPARLEHPRENHLRLLGAYAASRARTTHALVLAGADWGAGPLIRAGVARRRLGDRVVMLGYVSAAEALELAAGADAVVIVGQWDGCRLAELQALSAGRPLVTSDLEVAGDLGVLCDPHDERSIASALDRVIDDEALHARARREGPRRVRELLRSPEAPR